MKIGSATSAVTRKFGRQVLALKKNSPALMFGAGVIGVAATVVLACKATLKLEETLETGQEHLKYAREIEDGNDRMVALTYVKTAYDVTKLYTPALLVGVASVAALTGAHVAMNRRVAGLTAAYAVVDRGFKDYRKRVVDELGLDKDLEFFHGVEDREIVEETDQGPIVKTVKRLKSDGRSPYSFYFEKGMSENWESRPGANQTFVKCAQSWANDMLKARGWLTLNDVLDMLGMQRTQAGMVVGWVYGKGTGDDYIDFGIFANGTEAAQRFVNCWEPSVLLDFNVDGNIFKHMEE